MEISLCSGKECCPKVITTKRNVTIGEKGNLVQLKAQEWNLLVEAIKDGKIGKI